MLFDLGWVKFARTVRGSTLVERHTRYVMLVKLVDKDSYTVAAALARHAQILPQELYRSLTWD